VTDVRNEGNNKTKQQQQRTEEKTIQKHRENNNHYVVASVSLKIISNCTYVSDRLWETFLIDSD
tara:strand:+ start:206 stop:397 length:192 start_codon:yes stop_codon:yes gene_type:complete